MTSTFRDYDGQVADILNDREVVINLGSQNGIESGHKFVVFSLGDEIPDPNTGESLGRLELIKGRGEVVHVQQKMCTIKTYEYTMAPLSVSSVLDSMDQRKVYRSFEGVVRGDYVRILE